MTRDDRPPDLTIVIAAGDSPEAASRAVTALVASEVRAEILVVFAAAPGWPVDREGWIAAPPGSGVPRLRRVGLDRAEGRVVVFTEDSCLAASGWAVAWTGAFADPRLVAGSGVVEPDPDAGIINRAVFLCEYAPFVPPLPSSTPTRLAGNNFAVLRRFAVARPGAEVHETCLLDDARAAGLIRHVEGATVRHVRRFVLGAAVTDRFRFGREYGGLRSAEFGAMARLAGVVAGPLIWIVQAGRLAALLAGKPRLRPLFDALPAALALLAFWSLGESIGRASPGRGITPGKRGTDPSLRCMSVPFSHSPHEQTSPEVVRRPHGTTARSLGRPPARLGGR